MLAYEGDPVYAERSAVRYRRAAELLSELPDGSATEDGLRAILSDHEHAPDSLCRHEVEGVEGSVTCFWCVADVTDMRITFGRGNPCDSVAQEFDFAGSLQPSAFRIRAIVSASPSSSANERTVAPSSFAAVGSAP